MRLAIKSRAAAAGALLITLGMSAGYMWLAGSSYYAWSLARTGTPEQLERAIALEPSNAEHVHARGLHALFKQQDAERATAYLERALALNPYPSRYWLDLAAARAVRGDTERQKAAVEAAVEAEPTNPALSWEAANLMLVSGDVAAALRMFRINLETDPAHADEIFDICWRAAQDADRILREAVPATAQARLSFLKFLVARGAAEQAAKVWKSAAALRQPFDGKQALPYVNFLLQQKQPAEARQVWQEMVTADSHFGSYMTPGNLIVNGRFDNPLLNSGLDWRLPGTPLFKLALDPEQFHGGGRSLAFDFTGEPAGDTGVYQYIPVEAQTDYDFSGYVKTEEIYTASGPRIVLEDADSHAPLLRSEELVGTAPWKQVHGSFRTPAETRLLALRVVQEPRAHIKGGLWIGDMTLTRH